MHYDGTLPWAEYQDMCENFRSALVQDMEGYLERKEYAEVDRFLQVTVVDQTDHSILVVILRTTRPYSVMLNEYERFYQRVRAEVSRMLTEKDAERLLRGF